MRGGRRCLQVSQVSYGVRPLVPYHAFDRKECTKVHDDTTEGVTYFRKMLNLMEHLAEQKVAVYELKWYRPAFSSWSLVAGTRERRFEFSWDGRDFVMDVSICDEPFDRYPFHWKHIRCERISKPGSSDEYDYIKAYFQSL